MSVQHTLEKVTSNGLPEKKYNSTLSDFDHHMCSLFDNSDEGIIFLIETFSGKRNYYFYTLPSFSFESQIDITIQQFAVNLEHCSQEDISWGFLKEYPVKLFPI